jgi:hypothetical protein
MGGSFAVLSAHPVRRVAYGGEKALPPIPAAIKIKRNGKITVPFYFYW